MSADEERILFFSYCNTYAPFCTCTRTCTLANMVYVRCTCVCVCVHVCTYRMYILCTSVCVVWTALYPSWMECVRVVHNNNYDYYLLFLFVRGL